MLIANLLETEQRLEELTGGEVDTVTGSSGRPYLLRRAQEQLRDREAEKRAAILNALPAHIALLDAQGTIVSVNEVWCQFADANGYCGPPHGVGLSYLEVCDQAMGLDAADAKEVAAGVRAVLAGADTFSLEYPCHSPTEQRWFIVTVAPLTGTSVHGAVVMHLNVTERRRVEQELKQAKIAAVLREGAHRYNFLADTVPLIIWTARADGGIDYYNKAWFDYTGLTLAQTENWGWDAVVHPDDLQRCIERWTRSVTTGEDYEIEYRFKRAGDGTYRWFLGRASARRDEQGEIQQWVGTGTDIDDQKRTRVELERRVTARTAELSNAYVDLVNENAVRKRTATELRESNEKFHQMADNITDAFWVRSPDLSEVHYISPAFERIWGRTVESLYANPREWSNFIVPEDRARVQSAFDALKTDTPSLDLEYRIARPNGEIRWVHVRGFQVRNAANDLIRHTGIVTDITDRKHTEEHLQRSQALLRMASRLSRLGAWSVELPEGKLTLSEEARVIHEMPAGATPTIEGAVNCYAPEFRESITQHFQACVEHGTPFDVELQLNTDKGQRIWVRSIGEAVRDANGLILRAQGTIQDITERKQLAEQLRQAQKMEAVGTLAGGIAHDFNNILTAIRGYTELARLTLHENPKVRTHLEAVLKATTRAAEMVRQILAFSRQETVERRPVQLRPVVEECLGLLRATLPPSITFDVSLGVDAPTVLANTTQVHQILMNLGTNAGHAMKDRAGRLQVKLERFVVDATHGTTLARLRPGVYARLSVADTGAGMDQATQRRIFEPFFTTKGPGQGTGLGLALVHGIMDSHDGAITVYSEPGEGAVFHLYFPEHGASSISSAAMHGLDTSGHGERILLVDDEELLVQMGQEALTVLGYKVEATTQPAAALEMVRADPLGFALVITDQTMPGMTGLVLASRIRDLSPAIPIILTTGYSLALTPERLQAAGIFKLLPKPPTIESLSSAVRAAIASR